MLCTGEQGLIDHNSCGYHVIKTIREYAQAHYKDKMQELHGEAKEAIEKLKKVSPSLKAAAITPKELPVNNSQSGLFKSI